MSELSPLDDLRAEAVALPGAMAEAQPRKPRLAIMGEFSAGKSTLSNLLLEGRPLPERVTATRVAPVWISADTAAPYRVTVDGAREAVEIDALDAIEIETTRVIRIGYDAQILDRCDLIDFPGISDPNMDPEVIERVLGEVDMVLWCTAATQAWRQSEAAFWEDVPEAVRARSLLMVTRIDKLTNDRDRERVLSRLAAETGGLFAGMFPISPMLALKSAETWDEAMWRRSGAEEFAGYLVRALGALRKGAPMPPLPASVARYAPAPDAAPEPARQSGTVIPRRRARG